MTSPTLRRTQKVHRETGKLRLRGVFPGHCTAGIQGPGGEGCVLVKSSPLMQQRAGETEACPRCFASPLRRPISSDLCYLESLPETLASFLPSQARQAGYREYNTTHWVPLPYSCSPGDAQARGDRGFSESQTLGSGLSSPCARREGARAGRRNQWHSHHPPASAQGTRVWLRGR